MTEYKVTWEIEIEADSPEEAAKIALEIQRDPRSTSVVFDVCSSEDYDTIHTIDLDEQLDSIITYHSSGSNVIVGLPNCNLMNFGTPEKLFDSSTIKEEPEITITRLGISAETWEHTIFTSDGKKHRVDSLNNYKVGMPFKPTCLYCGSVPETDDCCAERIYGIGNRL